MQYNNSFILPAFLPITESLVDSQFRCYYLDNYMYRQQIEQMYTKSQYEPCIS